ncbi:MAG: hypothetical protein HGB04_04000 [Chlorobiaceae bacterium]|nr:hypothetical protein [Chlorobiaceae bacterium]
MIAGVKHTFPGGRILILPPLSIAALKLHKDDIKAMREDIGNIDNFEKAVTIITASAKRNYPDITEAEIEDLLDVKSVWAVFRIVMGSSGLEETIDDSAQGEAAPVRKKK